MQKRVVFLALILLFSLALVTASDVDNQIQKLTHYAEEYETGNINYVQLLVHTSAVREGLNEVLGVTKKEMGGVVKEEQIKKVLGEPNEYTKWVWIEESQYEKKLDNDVPIWKKIVFDGKKIQIKLAAFPSLYKEEIIYRLNFETEFKKPEEQLDVKSKIDKIKVLAEEFNADPSSSNAEVLAKESVNTERAFESLFRQGSGNCEDTMAGIFGSENKRDTQQLLVYEIDFYEGEDFEAIMRLEMCDDCEWNWVNMNMWFESRGRFKMPEQKGFDSMEEYKGRNPESYKAETKKLIGEIKGLLETGDYGNAISSSNKLNMLTQAWNEKSNDISKEIDVIYKAEEKSMNEEERQKMYENYGWIKQEQERRQQEKSIRNENYQERKAFYLGLFADYEKKENYFEQTEYQKRLVEEFKERGEEICDNGQDDNDNGETDCSDAQCGGKVCGRMVDAGVVENESFVTETNLYCIAGECTAREEIVMTARTICGNNICEEGEAGNGLVEDGNISSGACPGDCMLCEEHQAINCSGKVIFSGEDEKGCPLEPVCIQKDFCESDEACKFLCGEGKCIEGKCEVAELTECEEPECVDGQEKILNCNEQELVKAICVEGLWEETGVACEVISDGEVEEEIVEGEVVGEECVVKSDCGGENDVCSNGKCVTLPENVGGGEPVVVTSPPEEESPPAAPEEEVEEVGEEPEPEISEESEPEEPEQESAPEPEPAEEPSEPEVTGNIIFNFFMGLGQRLGITGFAVEDGGDDINGGDDVTDDVTDDGGDDVTGDSDDDGGTDDKTDDDNYIENGREENREGEQIDREGDWEEKDNRERERNEGENKKRCEEECSRMCYDNEVRPCVEECIREECGNEFDCDADSVQKSCEGSCGGNTNECVSDCVPKCTSGGENWWQEFQREPEEDTHKEEKGVFQVGGGCRKEQGKTKGFIWFGGWGEPFKDIEKLKQRYYQGGEADWCKWDMENLIKQRKEFEQGFNQEFVEWFFEKYLANSAEDWEKHVSGIFELYWKDVDNSRQIAERMKCLEQENFPEVNLINVQYESEYGMIEFWEEMKTMELGEGEKVKVVSPYMKIWIFPSKEVIKIEMKKGMEKGKMPGPSDEEEQMGPTEEEKKEMRRDKGFMESLNEITSKYGESFDSVIQFKDFEKDEVVFNLYVKMDKENLISVEPMLYSEVPSEDARVELDFEILYDIIYTSEKEMRGIETESPPWDKKKFEPVKKIKEITTGTKMWFKVRDLMGSAKYYPESAEKEMKPFVKDMLGGMFGGPGGPGGPEDEMSEKGDSGEEKGIWESKEVITGEVILEN